MDIGKCMGMAYPCGLQVWVPTGLGMGIDSHTHHLQNKSKNIFFGGELIEIWCYAFKYHKDIIKREDQRSLVPSSF